MKHRVIGIGAGAAGLALALSFAWWPAQENSKLPEKPAPLGGVAPSTARAEPTPIRRPSAPSLTPASLEVTRPRPATILDEASIMSTLRTLGDSEPARSLQLAHEAEQRFPGSADAPEQAWYVCKSLVNLERFYEARDEARAMVDQYPATPWAEDVARHLLVNPLGLPGDPAP
jgi:hypothetical protein